MSREEHKVQSPGTHPCRDTTHIVTTVVSSAALSRSLDCRRTTELLVDIVTQQGEGCSGKRGGPQGEDEEVKQEEALLRAHLRSPWGEVWLCQASPNPGSWLRGPEGTAVARRDHWCSEASPGYCLQPLLRGCPPPPGSCILVE